MPAESSRRRRSSSEVALERGVGVPQGFAVQRRCQVLEGWGWDVQAEMAWLNSEGLHFCQASFDDYPLVTPHPLCVQRKITCYLGAFARVMRFAL